MTSTSTTNLLTRQRKEGKIAGRDCGEALSTGIDPVSDARSVSAREFRFVTYLALGIVLLASIPYGLAYAMSSGEKVFVDTLAFEPDFNAYFAFMNQARNGNWLFYNPFTPEAHDPVFFNLEWLVLGKLSALTGMSLGGALQVQRVMGTVALCMAIYWLTCFFFKTVLMRRLVLVAVVLGGGFGWAFKLPWVGMSLPANEFGTALHPFFWMLFEPHFATAEALSVVAVCLFLRGEARGNAFAYVLAALACTAAGAMRPFEMLWLVCALSLYMAVGPIRTASRSGFSLFLLRSLPVVMSTPLFAYYIWIFKIHPVFQWWGTQNLVAPPLPGSLAVSLGLALVLLVIGLANVSQVRRNLPPQSLIVCGLIASIGLLYCYPLLTFTAQFGTTLLIPAVFAGAMHLEPRILSWVKGSGRARLGIAFVLMVNCLTSIVLVVQATRGIAAGENRSDVELIAAYSWLDTHSNERDLVMAPLKLSNQLPRYTNNVSFCGYRFNTVRYEKKKMLVEQFYDAGTSDVVREQLINQFKIRYVLARVDDEESATYNLDESRLLERRYRNGAVTVFEVTDRSAGETRNATGTRPL